MMLYALTLTRIEVALAETQRHRGSVQARLLAESALAVLQDRFARLPDPLREKIEGKIEGVGQYWAEAAKGTDAARGSNAAKMGEAVKGVETARKASPAPSGALRPVYRVGGTVENVRTRHVCTMDIVVRDGALEVQKVSTRLLPLPPPPRPQVE
jgi:hypothetical protein